MFRRKPEPTELDRKQRAIGEFLHSLTMLTLAVGKDEASRLAASAALAVAQDDALASFLDKARPSGSNSSRSATLVAR